MFAHGTEERLNKDTSLESFRNHINTKLTFREALNKICSLLRKRISHVELSHKRQKKSYESHLLRSDAEYTDSVARETCLSPKHNAFDNLTSNPNMNSDVIDRFKYCKGKPVCRVSDIDCTRSGVRAKGACIACKKKTNWYCISCRNFACHDTTNSTIKYIADVNKDKNGNHITAVKSCFIHCHPSQIGHRI